MAAVRVFYLRGEGNTSASAASASHNAGALRWCTEVASAPDLLALVLPSYLQACAARSSAQFRSATAHPSLYALKAAACQADARDMHLLLHFVASAGGCRFM